MREGRGGEVQKRLDLGSLRAFPTLLNVLKFSASESRT